MILLILLFIFLKKGKENYWFLHMIIELLCIMHEESMVLWIFYFILFYFIFNHNERKSASLFICGYENGENEEGKEFFPLDYFFLIFCILCVGSRDRLFFFFSFLFFSFGKRWKKLSFILRWMNGRGMDQNERKDNSWVFYKWELN